MVGTRRNIERAGEITLPQSPTTQSELDIGDWPPVNGVDVSGAFLDVLFVPVVLSCFVWLISASVLFSNKKQRQRRLYYGLGIQIILAVIAAGWLYISPDFTETQAFGVLFYFELGRLVFLLFSPAVLASISGLVVLLKGNRVQRFSAVSLNFVAATIALGNTLYLAVRVWSSL